MKTIDLAIDVSPTSLSTAIGNVVSISANVAVAGPPGASGRDGIGVPSGGLTGQFLKKTGSGDYALNYANIVESDIANLPTDLAAKAQGLVPTSVKTGAYTANASDFVPVDTTSGNIAITLPNAPADKTRIGIKMIAQGGSNVVSFVTTGSDVFNKTGGATTGTLTLLNQGVLLQYSASSGIWYVQADDLPLSQLDSRYQLLSAKSTANGYAGLDGSSLVPAANMRPFNYRGNVAGSTTYNPWDVVVYKGRRILITTTFTTSSGTNPFISAANYVQLSQIAKFYATDYGVTADGSTDNYSLLNSLLQYANANGGGTVELPYGLIMTSKTIIIPSNVYLVGQGIATQLKLMSGSNCDVVQFETFNSSSQATILGLTASSLRNAFYAGIKDMSIHGNKVQQSATDYHHCVNATTNPTGTVGTGDPDFDPKNIISNVEMRNASGDGFFANGRSDMRLTQCVSRYNDGNGYTPSFDTHFDHCLAQSCGLAGLYINHTCIQGTGVKSNNNGANNQWTSGNNYALNQAVMYSGSMYRAINALTADTVAPPSDPTNWAAITPTSAQAWGAGFYWDSNGGFTTFVGCDAQQNSAHGYHIYHATSVVVSGNSDQPNFNQTSGSNNSTNPNYYAGLCIDSAQRCIVTLGCDAMGPAGYVFRLVTSGTAPNGNHVTIGDDLTATAMMTPDSITLIGSGNNFTYNGKSQTNVLNLLNDVNLSSPADGQFLSFDGPTSKWVNRSGPGVNYMGFSGDGSDGSVTLDGTTTYTSITTLAGSTYTLKRDIYVTSLTINNGVTLIPAGYKIFCLGTVTNNGTISQNGNNASGGTAGANTGNGSLGGGQAGGAGNTGAGSAGTGGGIGVANGGAGGAGGTGAAGGAGSSQNTSTSQLRVPYPFLVGLISVSGGSQVLRGGSGGGGGGGDGTNKGGGGGSGGGLIVIFAHTLTNAGTISATGGNGANGVAGNAGGGGGGGGGAFISYTLNSFVNTGTITLTGGTAGSGVGTGANGVAGGTGSSLNIVLQ